MVRKIYIDTWKEEGQLSPKAKLPPVLKGEGISKSANTDADAETTRNGHDDDPSVLPDKDC